jgi:amphi-Trp domain-containing protein
MESEVKERSTMSREHAAARLRAIADELASGNDIIPEGGGARFVAKVPDGVALKIEFEVEDDKTEFEIELNLVHAHASLEDGPVPVAGGDGHRREPGHIR